MHRSAQLSWLRPLLWALTAPLLWLVGGHLQVARLRLDYAWDLNFWSEDFFFTSLLKLRAGSALYGPIADANSSVYAPGQIWLHYALLAPFGAELSVAAHKLVEHGIALSAVAVATMLGLELTRGSPLSGRLRGFVLAPSFALAVYSNPLVDGLHPCNLEALFLAAAAWLSLAMPRLRSAARGAGLLLLPTLAFLGKQSMGAVVLVTLAVVAVTTLPRMQRRASLLYLALGACGGLALIHLLLGRNFWQWGVVLLGQHAFEWHRVRGLASGVGPWFAPVLVLTVARLGRALLRRSDDGRVWLRAGAVVLVFAPAALLALFKTRGGSNNTASLGFALCLVALPALLDDLARSTRRWLAAGGVALWVCQALLWRNHRYVPTARDHELAAATCDYAATRMRCGERVWLGRGASCYARGGRHELLDRMPSVRDVVTAGRQQELGLLQRLDDAEYDLILLHEADLRFLGPSFWPRLNRHYRLFQTGGEHAEGDYWVHGFQGWGSRRVLYYERKRDQGSHRKDAHYGCAGSR